MRTDRQNYGGYCLKICPVYYYVKDVMADSIWIRRETGLHEILDIIPRKRRKADAYYALKKQLRDEYGVELVIESTRGTKQ